MSQDFYAVADALMKRCLDEAYAAEARQEPVPPDGIIVPAIVAALIDARSSALEEAAKVADARARVSRLADKPSQLIHVSMTLAQFEAEAIATAIRALKEGAKP